MAQKYKIFLFSQPFLKNNKKVAPDSMSKQLHYSLSGKGI